MNKCFACMEDATPGIKQCPHCGYSGDNLPEKEYFLPPGTIIRGEFLCGTVMEEKEDCIEYIGYDFSRDCKVIIKEFFPLDYLCRGAEDDVAEIREGFIEEYEQQLGDFIKKYRSLAESNETTANDVYKCFLENNTCYVVLHCNKAPQLHQTPVQEEKTKDDLPPIASSVEVLEKKEKNNNESSSKKPRSKLVLAVAVAVVALIFMGVIAAVSASDAIKSFDTSVENIICYVNDEKIEQEFTESSGASLVSREYNGKNLEKEVVGEAGEMYLEIGLKNDCTLEVRHGENIVSRDSDGRYKINLSDSGKIEVVSFKNVLFGLFKNKTSYSFNYQRKTFAKLKGLKYIVNGNGEELAVENFNPEVGSCGIWLSHSTTSLAIVPETEKGIKAELDYGNPVANSSGSLEITAGKEAHTIAVKITVTGDGKETNTYTLNVLVEAKPEEVNAPSVQNKEIKATKGSKSGNGNINKPEETPPKPDVSTNNGNTENRDDPYNVYGSKPEPPPPMVNPILPDPPPINEGRAGIDYMVPIW